MNPKGSTLLIYKGLLQIKKENTFSQEREVNKQIIYRKQCKYQKNILVDVEHF